MRLATISVLAFSLAAAVATGAEPSARVTPPAGQTAAAAGLAPRDIAQRVAAEFMRREKIPANYTNDLTLEALLALSDATGDAQYRKFVDGIMQQRGVTPDKIPSYRSQPFNCVTFAWFERTRDARYFEPFVAEMRLYRREAPRAFDGAVSHYGDPKLGRILIDQLQDYSARMARAGWLSGDATFFEEAARQYGLFRAALRNPKTGLWGHARGWFDEPRHLTPTAWGRGQGWVLRGFVETLTYLPTDSAERRQMQAWHREFASDLIRFQSEGGMWRQVVDDPGSFEETSATALMSAYFARGIRQGLLPEQPFKESALRGYEALRSRSIDAAGRVYLTCIGTGPQPTKQDYLAREPPINDQHGVATVILACVGRLLLDGAPLPQPLPRGGQ